MLLAGADKVGLNTAAVERPEVIREAARQFGSQCIVVAIDAKRADPGRWEVYVHGGRTPTGLDAVAWARRVAALGAGELLLTSMDEDGREDGYDLDLTRAVTRSGPDPGDRVRRRRRPAASARCGRAGGRGCGAGGVDLPLRDVPHRRGQRVHGGPRGFRAPGGGSGAMSTCGRDHVRCRGAGHGGRAGRLDRRGADGGAHEPRGAGADAGDRTGVVLEPQPAPALAQGRGVGAHPARPGRAAGLRRGRVGPRPSTRSARPATPAIRRASIEASRSTGPRSASAMTAARPRRRVPGAGGGTGDPRRAGRRAHRAAAGAPSGIVHLGSVRRGAGAV